MMSITRFGKMVTEPRASDFGEKYDTEAEPSEMLETFESGSPARMAGFVRPRSASR